MRPLLLHGFGTSVRVNGRTLEIDWRSEGRKETYRPQQLPFDSVVVDSLTGSVSFEALRFLALHDVPVTLLRWNGTVLSTILPRGPSNGELRVAQIGAYSDEKRRLKIAREFIREKVAKSVELAGHFSRTLPVSPETIHNEALSDRGSTLNDLRVYEARVAQAYWREYAKAVESLWPKSGFVSRRSPQRSWNNSAADPTNALLNYGYSLLESACRSAIISIGLLPEIGFLHEVAPSKFPSAYDLQEPFRWLVDLSVIETIRDGKLDRKRDFIVTENYHVRLPPTAARAILDRLSVHMGRTIQKDGRSFHYDTYIQEIARRLARCLTIRGGRLDLSFPFQVSLGSYLTSQAKENLLTMTLAERKAAGISKTTWHYIRKRALGGGPVRVYRKVSQRLESPAPFRA